MTAAFDIAGRPVGPDHPPLVIAEIGINHEGSLDVALQMVDAAADAGAEIVMPPTDTDYGSRDFVCRDPEGYLWCFGTYWSKAHEKAD